MWDGFSHYAGGSAAAFNQLGALYGYRLIYCESHGVNCFLVREDFISDFSQDDDGGGSGGSGGGKRRRRNRPTIFDIHRPPNFFGKALHYPAGNGEWVWPFLQSEL